jgi:hypothetical protein
LHSFSSLFFGLLFSQPITLLIGSVSFDKWKSGLTCLFVCLIAQKRIVVFDHRCYPCLSVTQTSRKGDITMESLIRLTNCFLLHFASRHLCLFFQKLIGVITGDNIKDYSISDVKNNQNQSELVFDVSSFHDTRFLEVSISRFVLITFSCITCCQEDCLSITIPTQNVIFVTSIPMTRRHSLTFVNFKISCNEWRLWAKS